jgi:hypothetical protein
MRVAVREHAENFDANRRAKPGNGANDYKAQPSSPARRGRNGGSLSNTKNRSK